MSGLASVFWHRFELTGSTVDLNEAILMDRETLSLYPIPHPSRSVSLNNLATALFNRFKQTGLVTDLQEAILLLRESLFLRSTYYPYYPDYNLANALIEHFNQTSSMTDLEEAILLHRESLFFYPTPHPQRFLSLRDLAYALGSRSEDTGSMATPPTLKKLFQCFVKHYPSILPQSIDIAY